MSETDNPYKPIACGLHSQYELAIMHRSILPLVWTDTQGNAHHGNYRPLDVKTTASKEEFLVVADNEGQHLEIRLDRITQVEFPEN